MRRTVVVRQASVERLAAIEMLLEFVRVTLALCVDVAVAALAPHGTRIFETLQVLFPIPHGMVSLPARS
jgi:hypothetical protein